MRKRLLLAFLAFSAVGSAMTLSNDFSVPFGPTGPFMTNFAYGRSGAIMAASASRQYANAYEPGLLTLRGWTHLDSGLNGFWAFRWVQLTNLFDVTPENPLGFEVIRHANRLDFSAFPGIDENRHMWTGIGFYSDPDGRVTETYTTNTANQWQNGAGYYDFGEFEGPYGSAAADIRQTLQLYYAGDDIALSNELRTALRPDGTTVNVTNLLLRKYRGSGASTVVINNEVFNGPVITNYFPSPDLGITSNANLPSVGINSNGFHFPTNTGAWLVLPALSNVTSIRFTHRISNNVAGSGTYRFVIEYSTNGSNEASYWMPFQSTWPGLFTNSGNYNTLGATATSDFQAWEGPIWHTNFYVRIRAASNTVDFFLDSLFAYGAVSANTNKIGFRLTHDGSAVTAWINPNPYADPGNAFPAEWLQIDRRSVLFKNAVQCMIGHAARRTRETGRDNSYAHANFDDFLIRAATSGSAWRMDRDGDGFALLLSNDIRSDDAGVNVIRLEGMAVTPDPEALRVTVGNRSLRTVRWNPARWPALDEVAWIRREGEIRLVLGAQQGHREGGFLAIRGLPPPSRDFQVSVNAEQFDAMPPSLKGRYATCGWQRSSPWRVDAVVER